LTGGGPESRLTRPVGSQSNGPRQARARKAAVTGGERQREADVGLGCSDRHRKGTRTTTCSQRTQRRASGVTTMAHGGGRRVAAAAQDRRAREGAVKRGNVRKTHRGAPHLHAQLLGCFTTAGMRRMGGAAAAARLGLARRRRRLWEARALGRRRSGAAWAAFK
jgi:hypothetical protein